MKVHPSITPERLAEAIERSMVTLDSPGFCVSCGAEVEGVEPDARRYPCDACGQRAVYGAEELLMVVF